MNKRPNTFSNIKSRLYGVKQRIHEAAQNWFEGRFSKKERQLDATEYEVKMKLGKSFFTRQLHPRTRASRIAQLTLEEKVLASYHGWVNLTQAEARAAFRKGLIEA